MDKEINNGSPSHGTIPCWPEVQLPPSLKGVLLLSPTPQVEKLRGRVDKQLPLPTNQEAQQDLNPELTVKKPLLPLTSAARVDICWLKLTEPLGT